MKVIIPVLVFLGVFALFLFVIDPAIVAWIVKTADPSIQWIGTIKLIAWGVILFFGTSVTFVISLLAASVAAVMSK